MLEFGGRNVAAGFEQSPVVEPVDVFQGGDLDVLRGPSGPAGLDQLGLNRPITDSASALSYASPTVPTEGWTPAAASRSVNAIEVYWADSTGRRNTLSWRCCGMGAGKRQQAIRAMRGQMWSPGRPSAGRREDRVRFWEAIAGGVSSEDAAAVAGVSQAVGTRWFRQAGGLPPIMLAPLSGAVTVVRRAGGDRNLAGAAARGADVLCQSS